PRPRAAVLGEGLQPHLFRAAREAGEGAQVEVPRLAPGLARLDRAQGRVVVAVHTPPDQVVRHRGDGQYGGDPGVHLGPELQAGRRGSGFQAVPAPERPQPLDVVVRPGRGERAESRVAEELDDLILRPAVVLAELVYEVAAVPLGPDGES